MKFNEAVKSIPRKVLNALAHDKNDCQSRELPSMAPPMLDGYDETRHVPPGLHAPLGRHSWQNKLQEPHLAAAPRMKRLCQADGGLLLGGFEHLCIDVADLKVGDLCFYFKWGEISPVQRSIILAQRLHALLQIKRVVGSPYCCHCSIVVGIHEAQNRVEISEMSRHTNGAALTSLDFAAPAGGDSNVDYKNIYLFYRLSDEQVSAKLAEVGRAFGSGHGEYAMKKARVSWLRSTWVARFGSKRLEKIVDHAEEMPGIPYPMFCSEMVAAAGAAAVVRASEKRTGRTSPETLKDSAHRELFYRDPSGTLPMHLHGAVLRSKACEVVGYIFPNPPDEPSQGSGGGKSH